MQENDNSDNTCFEVIYLPQNVEGNSEKIQHKCTQDMSEEEKELRPHVDQSTKEPSNQEIFVHDGQGDETIPQHRTQQSIPDDEALDDDKSSLQVEEKSVKSSQVKNEPDIVKHSKSASSIADISKKGQGDNVTENLQSEEVLRKQKSSRSLASKAGPQSPSSQSGREITKTKSSKNITKTMESTCSVPDEHEKQEDPSTKNKVTQQVKTVSHGSSKYKIKFRIESLRGIKDKCDITSLSHDSSRLLRTLEPKKPSSRRPKLKLVHHVKRGGK